MTEGELLLIRHVARLMPQAEETDAEYAARIKATWRSVGSDSQADHNGGQAAPEPSVRE